MTVVWNEHPHFAFSWLSDLIRKSRKQQTLQVNDLYEIPSFLNSTMLTDKLESNWFDEIERHPTNPSLFRATIRTMNWKMLVLGLIWCPVVREWNHLKNRYLCFQGTAERTATALACLFYEILRAMFDCIVDGSDHQCARHYSADYVR